jgi:mevalonate kinase
MGKAIDIRARGKLLLTGEYLVLAGARALAMPLKFGQSMHVGPGSEGLLTWTSRELGRVWFTAKFDPVTLDILDTSLPDTAASLVNLLRAARDLNPAAGLMLPATSITTDADYPLNWGLGSSSSLIYLVARWLDVDPFGLFRQVSNGSGYDISCAGSDSLLFYSLSGGEHVTEGAIPGRALRDYAFFAYLGKKQDSRTEVESFRRNIQFTEDDIGIISELGTAICSATTADGLISLVNGHESVMGRILGREPLASRFKGFPGAVKSLGAWGGDFGMFVSESGFPAVKSELLKHDIRDVFTFDELIVGL